MEIRSFEKKELSHIKRDKISTMPVKAFFSTLLAILFVSVAAGGCSSAQEVPSEEKPLQKVSLSLTTPTPSWQLTPRSALQVGEEVWCFYDLSRREGMFAQVISQVSAEFSIATLNDSFKHFVLGKTWSWESDPHVNFIDSMDDISDQLKDAVPIEIVHK
ncbi:hypothetical protein MLD52_18405 [Puniceicoccaceae bacterium K14]|nr:hypothetical protein [Puniceicoccaceae bacterium K14]